MIHTDQTPRFGTYVIHGLTKFNHLKGKVYHLHMFCLANLPIQKMLNLLSNREHALFVLHVAAAHTQIERRDSDCTIHKD